MTYDGVAFQADLDLLQVPRGVLLMPRSLATKRSRLAKERGHDQAALTAAYERLIVYALKFAGMTLEPPGDDPAPATDLAPKEEDPDLVRYRAALAGRVARHDRWRRDYPRLRPQPSV